MIDAWVRFMSHDFICIPRTHLSNGSSAPSPGWLNLDGSLIPFGSTAVHEPTEMPKSLWARWKPLDATNKYNNEDKHLGTNGPRGARAGHPQIYYSYSKVIAQKTMLRQDANLINIKLRGSILYSDRQRIHSKASLNRNPLASSP
jgi:hypothetical protein